MIMPVLTARALDRILEPLSRALTPETAQKLSQLRIDRKTQARIDRLARKCNEGKLTDAERSEYETYVSAIDFVAILQAKARARLPRSATM
jgi:hypothetical protein